jgi:uncharacterized protein YlxW (UPF0749 family)
MVGFLLVAQVRTTEGLRDRLATEREEDLARILADLSRESDRLQSELTEGRLTLAAVQNSAQSDELALATLQRRLDDLRILAGVVPAEGQGVQLVVTDPDRLLLQDQLVDTVQELRDAGAEAIAVNGVRLIASSAFVTGQGRLLADGHPLDVPYRITAIGPAETMAKALTIPAVPSTRLSRYLTWWSRYRSRTGSRCQRTRTHSRSGTGGRCPCQRRETRSSIRPPGRGADRGDPVPTQPTTPSRLKRSARG